MIKSKTKLERNLGANLWSGNPNKFPSRGSSPTFRQGHVSVNNSESSESHGREVEHYDMGRGCITSDTNRNKLGCLEKPSCQSSSYCQVKESRPGAVILAPEEEIWLRHEDHPSGGNKQGEKVWQLELLFEDEGGEKDSENGSRCQQ